MLMAEAWQSKIVPALQGLQNIKLQRSSSPAEPDMQMVLVREPADEDAVAGGVFVSQLIRWQDHQPQLARVALMIGLHRTPRHKSLRHLGLRPTVNVTPAVVGQAQEWATSQRLSALLVCPLSGDGGALRHRLKALGFRDAGSVVDDDLRGHTLGHLDLHTSICEEAALMAWYPPVAGHEEL